MSAEGGVVTLYQIRMCKRMPTRTEDAWVFSKLFVLFGRGIGSADTGTVEHSLLLAEPCTMPLRSFCQQRYISVLPVVAEPGRAFVPARAEMGFLPLDMCSAQRHALAA